MEDLIKAMQEMLGSFDSEEDAQAFLDGFRGEVDFDLS